MELEWVSELRRNNKLLGDDAAFFSGSVLTVDMLTEGVDFLLEEVPPERIGRKALAVNLSDLAAMGAVPTGFLAAVALPRAVPEKLSKTIENARGLADALYAGMKPLIEKYKLELIGGDTNTWDGGLVISITALGTPTEKGLIYRNGGKSGDAILVTGLLGGSILNHQFEFEPRILESLYLNENYEIHAAIDISDGLLLDLHRLATESGLGAKIYEEAIPISSDAKLCAKNSNQTPLMHALSDGEDFELILAVPSFEAKKIVENQPLLKRFGVPISLIGELTSETGLCIVDRNGTIRSTEPLGYSH